MSQLRIENETFCGIVMPFDVHVATGFVTIPDSTLTQFHQDTRPFLRAHAEKLMSLRLENQAVLQNAFDLVADPDDWKGPILFRFSIFDLVRTGVTLPEVLYGIKHFTATAPLLEAAGNGWYTVSAEGYRMGPAGDH